MNGHFKDLQNVFEKHVDWISLIRNDDNYKNILQVKIQKEFKVTPHYLEIDDHSLDYGYSMGVYMCLGQPIHLASIHQSIHAYNPIFFPKCKMAFV